MTLTRTLTLLPLFSLLVGCQSPDAPQAKASEPASSPSGAASLSVKVDGSGYHPASVSAPAGKPVSLTITRTSDDGCGQQIVFPSLDIRRDLPLNRPVTVDFSMPASGSVEFTCGMAMLKGAIVAQ